MKIPYDYCRTNIELVITGNFGLQWNKNGYYCFWVSLLFFSTNLTNIKLMRQNLLKIISLGIYKWNPPLLLFVVVRTLLHPWPNVGNIWLQRNTWPIRKNLNGLRTNYCPSITQVTTRPLKTSVKRWRIRGGESEV